MQAPAPAPARQLPTVRMSVCSWVCITRVRPKTLGGRHQRALLAGALAGSPPLYSMGGEGPSVLVKGYPSNDESLSERHARTRVLRQNVGAFFFARPHVGMRAREHKKWLFSIEPRTLHRLRPPLLLRWNAQFFIDADLCWAARSIPKFVPSRPSNTSEYARQPEIPGQSRGEFVFSNFLPSLRESLGKGRVSEGEIARRHGEN